MKKLFAVVFAVATIAAGTPLAAEEPKPDRPDAATGPVEDAPADTLLRTEKPTAQSNLGGTYGNVVLDGDSQFYLSGIVLRPNGTARPHVVVHPKAGGAFSVLNAAVTRNLLYVHDGGRIGVGTEGPSATIHINGDTTPFLARSTNSDMHGFFVRDLVATEGYGSGVLADLTGNSMIRVSNLQMGYAGIPVIGSVSGPLYLNRNSASDVIVGQSSHAAGLHVQSVGVSTFAGSVRVAGDMDVSGNLAAKYQDIAEWVPSSVLLSPGTVVIVDPNGSNHVVASNRSYDTRVAGVVSPKPGIVLGEAGDGRLRIATFGRVRVKADAHAGAIEVGDLLVTSGFEGRAMKSNPVNVAGFALHRPGTILGKALEPLESGMGEILVLLSLQ